MSAIPKFNSGISAESSAATGVSVRHGIGTTDVRWGSPHKKIMKNVYGARTEIETESAASERTETSRI